MNVWGISLTIFFVFGFCLCDDQFFTLKKDKIETHHDLDHHCIHEEFAKSFQIDFQESHLKLEKRAEDWQPLTIHARFLKDDGGQCKSAGSYVNLGDGTEFQCTQDHVLTDQKVDYIVNQMIKETVNRYNSILSFDRTTRDEFISLNDEYSNGIVTPADLRHSGGGVDADFVLLFTARPIPTPGTLAVATTLAAINGRPSVGYANFDPAKLEMKIINSRAKELGIAIHEVGHSLGFSSSFFYNNNFVIDYNGLKMINSPKVLKFVRDHFGCSDLEGALLEDLGGGGTATSHWKKSVFMNEYMTGTASTNPIVSKLTMAYFQDAGWYRSNDSFTDAYGWGYKSGCSLPRNANCESIPQSSKCTETTVSKQCFIDRSGYGGCAGGELGLPSNCFMYYAETACMLPFPSGSEETKELNGGNNGESFEFSSKCFSSTLNKISSVSDLFPIPAVKAPKCYPTYCTNTTTLRVKVDGYYYRCQYSGGSLPIAGFGGSIDCSPKLADILCQNALEDDSWPLITSIEPKKAKPEETITIRGRGFKPNTTTEVVADFNCTDVVVIDETTITAKLPKSNLYGNPKYLNGFGNRISIIVKDNENRSDALIESFEINVPFGLSYITALFNWMKNNPILATILVAIIVIPCFCICYCIYRKCKSKKKKPKRGEYEEEYGHHDDEYYYDSEYVETNRNPPPKALQY